MPHRWFARHQGSQRAFSYRRRRGGLWLRAALAVPLALGPMVGLVPGGITQVAAAGSLDQSQPTAGGISAFIQSTIDWAQTFTAGISGNLDEVDLLLARSDTPPPTGDLTVQIKATVGGVPSGPPLASATVPEASVSVEPSFGWVSVPLSPPAPSIAGTQYAIVLSAPTTACVLGQCEYSWNALAGDPYTSGVPFISSDGGTTWTANNALNGADFAFKTFVTPALGNPKVTTKATPKVKVGGKISDAATLSGGTTPTGTISFQVFGPNNATCSGTAVFTSTKTVGGDGSYTSDPFKATKTGTYRWVAAYSGDANNNPATTACGDPGETSKVTKRTCPDTDDDSAIVSGHPAAKDDCD